MKNLLALAVAIVAAALLSTGCSTCCKKDGACTKPATTAAACTNQLHGFVFMTLECTNKPGALLVDCTNKFSLNLAQCTKGGCTNKLAVDVATCPGDCTNKFSAVLAKCTNSFAFGTLECTNKSSGLKI